MGTEELRSHCRLEDDAQRLLDRAFERLKLSARAVTGILKVARTIADLEGSEPIGSSQVDLPAGYPRMPASAEPATELTRRALAALA